MKRLDSYIRDNFDNLNRNQKKLAEEIINKPENFVMLTITESSQKLNFSEASMTRFVRALGFKSYGDFQNYLKSQLLNQLTHKNKILYHLEHDRNNENLIEKSLSQDIESISNGFQSLDQPQFNQIVDKIKSSNRVFLMGLGISKSLVSFLEFRFRRMGIDTRTLTRGGVDFLEELLSLKETDVIFATGFQKSYKEISLGLDYGNKIGCPTISFTENPLSPLAQKSKLMLLVKRGPVEHLNSLAYPMAVLNALVIKLAVEKEKETLKTVENFEWLKEQFSKSTDVK